MYTPKCITKIPTERHGTVQLTHDAHGPHLNVLIAATLRGEIDLAPCPGNCSS